MWAAVRALATARSAFKRPDAVHQLWITNLARIRRCAVISWRHLDTVLWLYRKRLIMVYCIVLVVASVQGKLVVLWALINWGGIGGLFVGEIETILRRVIDLGPWIGRSVDRIRHDTVLFYILGRILETGRRACRGGIRSARIDQLSVEVGRGRGDPGTNVDIEPEQGVGRKGAVKPVVVWESGNGSVEVNSRIVG